MVPQQHPKEKGAVENWGASNVERMKRGLAPERFSADTREWSPWISATSRSQPAKEAERLCLDGLTFAPQWPHSEGPDTDEPKARILMNLSEMFAHSQGEPIEVEGQLVHPIYKRTVRPNEELRLTVVRAREAPVHGIRMKLKAGLLQIADREPAGNVVLWTDRAPKSVVFRCQSKKPSELRIWNCWRDERNVMQAWIGSAGMIIEEKTDGTARLLCNSGHEVTFQDLVLELEAL